jgi:ankyrin repeat protein
VREIHTAAKGGKLEKIQDAINDGEDLNGLDEYGKPPIHYASQNAHLNGVKKLVAYGARKDEPDTSGHTAYEHIFEQSKTSAKHKAVLDFLQAR